MVGVQMEDIGMQNEINFDIYTIPVDGGRKKD
jgi:hypothetical protein